MQQKENNSFVYAAAKQTASGEDSEDNSVALNSFSYNDVSTLQWPQCVTTALSIVKVLFGLFS